MTAAVTVIVTRPGAAGQALADELQRAGQPSLWLPAFEFGAAPDEVAARATLAALADFDLAVFVSPQAARATAALLRGAWPSGTIIAAVGAGTRAAVASIEGAAQARVLAPTDADLRSGGSESLWPLLQRLPRLRRVLLLRAQAGREWLIDRLRETGVTVVPLAVYSRKVFTPPIEVRMRLAAAAGGELASVISSSDAVTALARMLAPQPEVLLALRRGLALATHPRIAEAMRSAQFSHVGLCAPDVPGVLAALRAVQPLESAPPAADGNGGRH